MYHITERSIPIYPNKRQGNIVFVRSVIHNNILQMKKTIGIFDLRNHLLKQGGDHMDQGDFIVIDPADQWPHVHQCMMGRDTRRPPGH